MLVIGCETRLYKGTPPNLDPVKMAMVKLIVDVCDKDDPRRMELIPLLVLHILIGH